MKHRFFFTLVLIFFPVLGLCQGWNVELLSSLFLDEAVKIAVDDDMAYIASGYHGFFIVDISDPTNPVQVGQYATPGHAWGLTVSGNYVYVAAMDSGLRVIDVSDPSAPFEVGYCYTTLLPYQGPCDAAIYGRYAYVAVYDWGLSVVDIMDPANPHEVGACYTGYVVGVAALGNKACMANGSDQMKIVDATNPANPFVVGYLSTAGFIYDVAVSVIYAYTANEYYDLQVVDLSDVTNPRIVGMLSVPSEAAAVAVTGNCAFVAARFEGLRVIDVANPDAPVEVGYYDILGESIDVAVAGIYAYIVDWNYFYIFDCSQAIAFFQVDLTISVHNEDVILRWETIPDAIHYRIYYQDTPYFEPTGIAQAFVSPPDTTWVDVGAVSQGKRYYQIVVYY